MGLFKLVLSEQTGINLSAHPLQKTQKHLNLYRTQKLSFSHKTVLLQIPIWDRAILLYYSLIKQHRNPYLISVESFSLRI